MKTPLTQQLSQWLIEQFDLICPELEEFWAVDTDLSLMYLGTAIATKIRMSPSRLESIAIAQQALQTFGSYRAKDTLNSSEKERGAPANELPAFFQKAFETPLWMNLEQHDQRTFEVRIDKHPWLSEILDGFIMHLTKAMQPQPAVVQIHDHMCTRFLIQNRQEHSLELPVHNPAGLAREQSAVMKRALIVDDDADVRQFCHMVLQQMGWQVEMASDGQKALAQLYQSDYQLIMLDGDMPNLNGSETAQRIRSAEARTQTEPAVIFAMSARASTVIAQRAQAAGCNLFLPKPLDLHLLQQHLAHFFPDPAQANMAKLDPMIATLLPQYLTNRIEDLQTMTAALAEHDLQTMQRSAHKIKGSGRSYGLFDLSELAAMMEFHISENDLAAVVSDLQEMKALLAKTQSALPQLKRAL